jgi:hypothetical protein
MNNQQKQQQLSNQPYDRPFSTRLSASIIMKLCSLFIFGDIC